MSSFHRAPLFAGSSKAEKKRELINYHIVMSQHWLVKQEPTAYSWDQFAAGRENRLDGGTKYPGQK
jgi:hypothetical protein